jgi:hypothetical protein
LSSLLRAFAPENTFRGAEYAREFFASLLADLGKLISPNIRQWAETVLSGEN